MAQKHFYGWRPQKPDHRDLRFAPPPRRVLALPPFVDQRASDPPVYDQGQEGSCTGNAGAYLDFRVRKTLNKDLYDASRDGLYGQALKIEGTFGSDNGAEIRDILKVIAQVGTWPENRPGDPANQPYNEHGYDTEPKAASLTFGKAHEGLVYAAVDQSLCQMKGVLATGYPIIIGFTVCSSFESDATAATGIVTMPGSDEAVLGGHAVAIVGYDDLGKDAGGFAPIPRCWVVRNSWGADWGDKGYCYFPYEYLLNPDLSDDFWVLTKVE